MWSGASWKESCPCVKHVLGHWTSRHPDLGLSSVQTMRNKVLYIDTQAALCCSSPNAVKFQCQGRAAQSPWKPVKNHIPFCFILLICMVWFLQATRRLQTPAWHMSKRERHRSEFQNPGRRMSDEAWVRRAFPFQLTPSRGNYNGNGNTSSGHQLRSLWPNEWLYMFWRSIKCFTEMII